MSFDYLKINGHRIQTTHQLNYQMEIDKSYQFLGKTNHQPIFDGKKFNVSLAAYSNGDDFIMIHSETHTDGSGGLDYSNLKQEKFSGLDFTSREQCAELSENDINEEHDLKFLKDKGFPPSPAVFIKQYFATSPGGQAEVVISFGKRLANCQSQTISSELKSEIDQRSRKVIRISKQS